MDELLLMPMKVANVSNQENLERYLVIYSYLRYELNSLLEKVSPFSPYLVFSLHFLTTITTFIERHKKFIAFRKTITFVHTYILCSLHAYIYIHTYIHMYEYVRTYVCTGSPIVLERKRMIKQ